MNPDNQKEYWDSVASSKTFTHPLDQEWMLRHVPSIASIIDYGCGYGRLVHQLLTSGYPDVRGYDTSPALIHRGEQTLHNHLFAISEPEALPLPQQSIDLVLLFAVLTCIPSNAGQRNLISLLHSRLRPGGILYLSDYYLQPASVAKGRYTHYQGDPTNAGIFHQPDGAILRHHTPAWITELLSDFTIIEQKMVEVKTMNGNAAEAFQMMVRR